MPTGLIIRDDYGRTILDYTTRVGKFIGSFQTNNEASGSYTDSRTIGYNFFHFIELTDGRTGGPTVTFNQSLGVISWEYINSSSGEPPLTIPNHTVYYGYY